MCNVCKEIHNETEQLITVDSFNNDHLAGIMTTFVRCPKEKNAKQFHSEIYVDEKAATTKRGTKIGSQTLHPIRILQFHARLGEVNCDGCTQDDCLCDDRECDCDETTPENITILDDKILILAEGFPTNILKIFDNKGELLAAKTLRSKGCQARGMTKVSKDEFATCHSRFVVQWKLSPEMKCKTLKTYPIRYEASAIHFNGTHFIVLHRKEDAITILDKEGKEVRVITIKATTEMPTSFYTDLYCDSETHDIYASILYGEQKLPGLQCLSIHGDVRWFMVGNSDTINGISRVHGLLCLATQAFDANGLIALLSKDGKLGRVLVDDYNYPIGVYPHSVYFDEETNTLVTANFRSEVHVFKVVSGH